MARPGGLELPASWFEVCYSTGMPFWRRAAGPGRLQKSKPRQAIFGVILAAEVRSFGLWLMKDAFVKIG